MVEWILTIKLYKGYFMKLIGNKKEKAMSLMYIFKQIFSSNMDILYFLSFYCILKDKKIIFKSLKYISPFIVYGGFQVLHYQSDNFNIIKLIVNVSKIYICILLYIYIKNNAKEINLNKIISYIALMFILLIPIALITKDSFLWRHNDIINNFSKTRLQLFYSEPSELAFHASLVLIFIMYFILKSTVGRKKNISIAILLSFLIYLTAGFGAIGGLIISLFIMFTINYFKKLTLRKIVYYYFGLIFAICLILLNMNSPLVLRANAVLNGNDASVSYRLKIGYIVMTQALKDTNMIGIGFGNLNTISTASEYANYGLVEIIANSFMYFITEGGLFAIIYLLIFNLSLLKNINRKNNLIKIPLLFFIIYYQIAGGYFTNPINWIVCGLISSDCDFLYKKFDTKFKIGFKKEVSL